MTSALVTGATGFIGTALVAHLRQLGLQVTTVGRFANPLDKHHVDLPRPENLEAVTSVLVKVQPNFVFHLAGVMFSENISDYYSCNVLYAVNILAAAVRVPSISKIVFIGSAAEYGLPDSDQPISEEACCRPFTPYGISKLAQTLHGIGARVVPVVVARLFNVIGPGMPAHFALGRFAKEVALMGRKGGVLRTGNLDVYRDFVDLSEAVSNIADLARLSESRGRIVNVCSGHPTKLRDLATSLVEMSGFPISFQTDPSRIRLQDPPAVYGDTRRLVQIGLRARPPHFDAILSAMLARAVKDVEKDMAP